MTELCLEGWAVPYIDKVFTYQLSYQVIPDVVALEAALHSAYAARGDQDKRESARAKAMIYDADAVVENHWKPALEAIERELKPEDTARAVTVAGVRGTRSDDDQWYRTGLWQDGWLHLPNRDPASDKALATKNGYRKVVDGWGTDVDGLHLDIEDDPTGGVAKIVCKEIVNSYKLHEINFEDGDIVLDIGAQVGVVSIYLAKKHPGIKVYAFEPVTVNYRRLLRNIEANGVTNIIAVNKAVTGDGRTVTIYGDLETNSGGSSIYGPVVGADTHEAPSVTLAQILNEYGIGRARLLKLDCEGAEYEIIGDGALLERVDIVRGELHQNNLLAKYDAAEFLKLIQAQVPDVNMNILRIPDVRPLLAEEAVPTPAVSVIIPTFNGEATIRHAVEAAFRQPGLVVEVVVVDDGSTDTTHEILARLKTRYGERLKTVRFASNLGQVEAMNVALYMATGRYILFHGDDDWLEPGGLAELVQAMDGADEQIGFAYGHWRYHGLREDLVFARAFRAEDFHHHFPAGNGLIWRAALRDKHNLYYRTLHEGKAAHAEDYDMILRLIKLGYAGTAVNTLVINTTLAEGRGTAWLHAHQAEVLPIWRERHPEYVGEFL
jgi:FkbM family methyltransferase